MLYLEGKKFARDCAKANGLEITPEDSFREIIRTLAQDDMFRDRANDLYRRYAQSVDEDERVAVMREAGSVIDEYRVAVYGEELVGQLSKRSEGANLGAFVSAEGIFAGYGYQITPEDIELLQEMLIEIRKTADGFRERYGHEGMHSSADFDKLAIAYVMDRRRLPLQIVRFTLNAVLASLFGGVRDISYSQRGALFCADLAIVCKILADEMGYLAEIVAVSVDKWKPYHQYVRFEDGSIYDPFGARKTYGYRKDDPYEGHAN